MFNELELPMDRDSMLRNQEYCGKFTTSNSCPSISCQWSQSGSKCMAFASSNTTPTDTCGSYTQSNCAMVAGCAWNGTKCASTGGSSSSTTGLPGSTTGVPTPTTGSQTTATTGIPTPTTGGNLPPSGACAGLQVWQCLLAQNCNYYLLPQPHCGDAR